MLHSRPITNFDKKTKTAKLIWHTTKRPVVDKVTNLVQFRCSRNMPHMATTLRIPREVKIELAIFGCFSPSAFGMNSNCSSLGCVYRYRVRSLRYGHFKVGIFSLLQSMALDICRVSRLRLSVFFKVNFIRWGISSTPLSLPRSSQKGTVL